MRAEKLKTRKFGRLAVGTYRRTVETFFEADLLDNDEGANVFLIFFQVQILRRTGKNNG